MNAEFLRELQKAIPADALLVGQEVCAPYSTDWTKLPGSPDAVVLPTETQQVSRVLALCSKYSIPVVPSGGRTGLAGGAVSREGELALNLSRMNRKAPVSRLARTVRVGAGTVTETV